LKILFFKLLAKFSTTDIEITPQPIHALILPHAPIRHGNAFVLIPPNQQASEQQTGTENAFAAKSWLQRMLPA
jgi:hypothetical protein